MTDNELDQLMQRVLLDAIKSDCEKENSVVPSFEHLSDISAVLQQ